ncbi:methyltransferase [Vulgatibacter sp.]|uniref:methyltransferase n=1 Tax=Vulgatibacter sp. TaxID=1971226 RepID=UPI0035641A03
MSAIRLDPASLLHLLWNGSKAIEVVQAASDLGVLAALEAGEFRLGELAARLELQPLRLYKLLDCLESLQLAVRTEDGETLEATRYRGVDGVRAAAERVLGPASIERDRDRQPWRQIEGRLPALLRGTDAVSRACFDWPPASEAQVASFERSMTAGLGPFRESFRLNGAAIFGGAQRWLDVGGGDGTLAASVLGEQGSLGADVFNLPAVAPLVEAVRRESGVGERLGFVGGDFLAAPLPAGYDVLSFVRVLHDWPTEVALRLLAAAREALRPGARIAICEEFRTPARLATQFFWSYFLVGVDSCVSRLREASFYVDALDRLGFDAIRVLPGPVEIVTGVRR